MKEKENDDRKRHGGSDRSEEKASIEPSKKKNPGRVAATAPRRLKHRGVAPTQGIARLEFSERRRGASKKAASPVYHRQIE